MQEFDGAPARDCDEVFIERHGNKWWAKALVIIWDRHTWEYDGHVFYDWGFGEGESQYHCSVCNAKMARPHGGGP